MTREEAVIVGNVLATADGGCPYCAADLAEGMREHFPQFDWMALVGQSDEDVSLSPEIRGGGIVYSGEDAT